MDQETYDRGLAMRRNVLGDAYCGLPVGVDGFRVARGVINEAKAP